MNKQLTQAYADFLQSHQWDYFATITFKRERRDSMAAIRDVWRALNPPGFQKIHRAFLACEPHQTGALHIHGLMLANFETNWRPLPYDFNVQDFLNHTFGRSRIEPARNETDVSSYCSKYVVKNSNIYDYAFLGDKKAWDL